MTDSNDKPPLKPAKVDLGEQRDYMPRVPWVWMLVVAGAITAVVVGYRMKQGQRAEELRAQMAQVHEEQLAPAADKILAFRERITTLVQRAAEREVEEHIDPRLKLAGLRSGQGLYLRVHASETDSAAHIQADAANMQPDAIVRCLGLTAASARTLYEKSTFLEPAWIEAQREEPSLMNLRVADEMLANHIRSDLPALLGLLKSDWFLLVIQQGKSRHEAPVDVFLWDLDKQELLLSTRARARGALLPTRIISQGKVAGHAKNAWGGSGAQDCSVAAQVRSAAGMQAAEVTSKLPTEDARDGEGSSDARPKTAPEAVDQAPGTTGPGGPGGPTKPGGAE